MLLGDPYKFSIYFKSIQEWNLDETFCNGLLFFFVDGNYFPKKVNTATLKCEIPPLKEKLMNLTINERLYSMEKGQAFKEIYNITFPENWDVGNDYRYDISPQVFWDNHCFVFAVSDGVNVRILASSLNYVAENSRHELEAINVSESYITIEEVNIIASKLNI